MPPLGGFSIDADTRRGEIEIAQRLAFVPHAEADVAAGPSPEEQLEALQDLGRQVAAEVRTRVEEQMKEFREGWQRRRREGRRGWSPHEEWQGFEGDRPWPWESPDWQWPQGDWGWRSPVEPDAKRWGLPDWRGNRLSGDVTGGGPVLRLRTDRGSIHVSPH